MNAVILVILALFWTTIPCFASSGDEFLGDWFVKKEIDRGDCNMRNGIHIEKLNKNIYAVTSIEDKQSDRRNCFNSHPLTVDFQNEALVWQNPLIGKLRITLKDNDDALMELNGGIWILTKENIKEKIQNLRDSAREAKIKHDPEKEIFYYSQVLKIDPDDSAALNNRGSVYRRLNQYQLALEDLSRSIKIDPKQISAYVNRSGVYSALNKASLAIQDINKAIEISPNDFFNYIAAAGICMNLGMYKEANSYLKQGEFHLDKKDQTFTAYLFAATAWLSSTSPDPSLLNGEKAVALSTRAIDILEPKDPSHRASYLNIAAAAYARNNQNAEAVKTQEEAIASLKATKNVKPEIIKEYEERLDIYRSGKAYNWTPKK